MKRLGTVIAVIALTVMASPVAADAAAARSGRIFYSIGAVLPDPDPGAGSQIWSVNPDGSDPQQLTSVPSPAEAGGPDVSPDGTRVLYVSNVTGSFQVWLMRADGEHQHRLITDPRHDAFVPRWAPDGQHLVFTRCTTPFGFLECTTAAVGVDGSGLHDLTGGHWIDFAASVAPDGGTVAFSSDRNGLAQAIFRVPTTGGPARRVTAARIEAFWPDYRPDGQRIVFGDNFDRPNTNLWTMRPDGSDLTEISHRRGDQNLAFARYAPDGTHLVADLFDGTAEWLVTLNSDGTGLTKIVETDNLTLADWGTGS